MCICNPHHRRHAFPQRQDLAFGQRRPSLRKKYKLSSLFPCSASAPKHKSYRPNSQCANTASACNTKCRSSFRPSERQNPFPFFLLWQRYDRSLRRIPSLKIRSTPVLFFFFFCGHLFILSIILYLKNNVNIFDKKTVKNGNFVYFSPPFFSALFPRRSKRSDRLFMSG